MRTVLTGSSGFVGKALLRRLDAPALLHLGSPDWRESLARIDFSGAVVIHLAARVHETRARAESWNTDNVEKTATLAHAAARGGARRFVFASTMKVHGDETGSRPFRPDDPFDPRDDYARSKALAEERLASISSATGIPVVTVRSPLVFGEDAKANLREALRLSDTPVPLPFGAIANRRSWIHVEDLCDLFLRCAQDDAPAGRAFIAAHDRPFSTPQLIGGLRARLKRPIRLVAMPRSVLEALAALAGRRESMYRLTRSLEGDAAAARALGWQPKVSFDAALDDLVAGYRGHA